MSGAALLLLKLAQEKNKTYHSSKKVSKDKKDDQSYSTKREYTYADHMRWVINSNPELLKFFDKLVKYGIKIEKEDIAQLVSQQQEIEERYSEEKQQLNEQANMVENVAQDMGVEFEGNSDVYSYEHKRWCLACTFNGIKVTKEMIEEGNNPYTREYEYWKDKNADIDTKKGQLEKELEDKKRKLKFNIFTKKRLQNEIEQTQEEIDSLNETVEKGEKLKKGFEFFENLTSEQKNQITTYIETLGRCNKSNRELSDKKREIAIIRFGYTSDEYEEKKWPRVMERMFAEGTVTQDEIDRVDDVFKQEINQDYDQGWFISGYKEVLEWYCGKIEKEQNIEKEKSPLQQRKEKKMEVLKTESTITKTEKLIKEKENKKDNEVGE